MATVDSALLEWKSAIGGVERRDRKPGDHVKTVIEARRQITQRIGTLTTAAQDDAFLKANPEIAQEFLQRLNDIRKRLATLQSNWRVAELTSNFAEYSAQSLPLRNACNEFLDWAITVRAGRTAA
jgi:hypothetical protein